MISIFERIKEIALKYCADYPDIEKADEFVRMYAIESTLEGTNQANKECHQMIKILGDRLGIDAEDVCEIWEKEIEKK